MSRRPWPAWVMDPVARGLLRVFCWDPDTLMFHAIPVLTGLFLVTGVMPAGWFALIWAASVLGAFGLCLAMVWLREVLQRTGWTPVTEGHLQQGYLPSLTPEVRAFWGTQQVLVWRDLHALGACDAHARTRALSFPARLARFDEEEHRQRERMGLNGAAPPFPLRHGAQ